MKCQGAKEDFATPIWAGSVFHELHLKRFRPAEPGPLKVTSGLRCPPYNTHQDLSTKMELACSDGNARRNGHERRTAVSDPVETRVDTSRCDKR